MTGNDVAVALVVKMRARETTADELAAVLTRLHLEPGDVVRHNEPAAVPLRDLPRDAAGAHGTGLYATLTPPDATEPAGIPGDLST